MLLGRSGAVSRTRPILLVISIAACDESVKVMSRNGNAWQCSFQKNSSEGVSRLFSRHAYGQFLACHRLMRFCSSDGHANSLPAIPVDRYSQGSILICLVYGESIEKCVCCSIVNLAYSADNRVER